MTEEAVIYGKQTGEQPDPLTIRIDWLSNGKIKPLMYWMPDGTCYEVMHVFEETPCAFLKEQGVGLRYKVRAKVIETPEPYPDPRFDQRVTYLYLADKRFCEKNIVDNRYGHAGKKYIPVTMDVFPNGEYAKILLVLRGFVMQIENQRG